MRSYRKLNVAKFAVIFAGFAIFSTSLYDVFFLRLSKMTNCLHSKIGLFLFFYKEKDKKYIVGDQEELFEGNISRGKERREIFKASNVRRARN